MLSQKKKTKLRGNKGAKCVYTRLATRAGTLLQTQSVSEREISE